MPDLKLNIITNKVATTTVTKTLDLDRVQVLEIVRQWARGHGFDPERTDIDMIDDGVTMTCETTTYEDDSDTPIEGD